MMRPYEEITHVLRTGDHRGGGVRLRPYIPSTSTIYDKLYVGYAHFAYSKQKQSPATRNFDSLGNLVVSYCVVSK